MPPPRGRGRDGASAPPMPTPGVRGRSACGRGRGGASASASATFKVPVSRRHQAVRFKARNFCRDRACNSRRGRSGPSLSEGWPQSPPCQDHIAEQTPLLCSSKLLSTLKESSTSTTSSSTPQAVLHDSLSSSPGPTILIRESPDWYLKFYIRMDRSRYFHTYPDVGGPFKSLQKAENAIDFYLQGLQHETMCKEALDKLSPMDRLIKQSLYWPDGRRRKCSEARALENTRTEMGHLLQALVDKYNEDYYLFGDFAYELKDALHYQTMWEGGKLWRNHFNFTTKTKGAGGIDKLFFAEVMEEDELTVSCLCLIDTDANGRCYGCTNNGSVAMKHPNDASAYNAGQPDDYLPFEQSGECNDANTYNAGHPDDYLSFKYSGEWDASDDDENVMTGEDRVKRIYEGLDDPNYLKNFFRSPHAASKLIEED